jgi:hypothetical protein
MKNWVKRAVRTFVQSAVGYVAVAVPAIDWTSSGRATLKTALVGLGVSAVSAGISAVMNIMDDMEG